MTHLLLSAGRGPQECCWALAELLKRLETEAAKRKVTVERVETVRGERPGTFRSVLVRLDGQEGAWTGLESFAGEWTGTLCWQAPSPYRSGIGRKNWYVISRMVEVSTVKAVFAEADVQIVPVRTGGPGGQHRNKASTAVRATHRPTGLVVVVDTERQLSLNRSLAMQLLRKRLEDGNAAAERADVTGRWHTHDELIRGNPTRTERP